MSPSGDVINGSDVTAASKEAGNDRYNDVIQLRDGLPPIKLRTVSVLLFDELDILDISFSQSTGF